MADLNKGLEADLFARYHFALDHYVPLADAGTPLVRVWVRRALARLAERLAAFVPDEEHPGEVMAAEAMDAPAQEAARWAMRADEAADALDPRDVAADELRRRLDEPRERILREHDAPVDQTEDAPAFLDPFHELWDAAEPGERTGLVPDALLAGFLRNNLRGEREAAARLYEEAVDELGRLVRDDGDLVLRQTLAGTVFRASYAHKFAGNLDRAQDLQRKGRNLADL